MANDCDLVKDIVLPVGGLVLLLAQINQQSLVIRKEAVRSVYSSFLSEMLVILSEVSGTINDQGHINRINSELAKLTQNASPQILDSIYVAIKKGTIGIEYINTLRTEMRKDLNPKWWEYLPVISQVIYSCLEAKVNRDHMRR